MKQPALADRVAVPFVDLNRMNEPIRAELLEAVSALVDSGAFVNGPAVGSFEEAFASYCGRPMPSASPAASTRSGSRSSPPGSGRGTR